MKKVLESSNTRERETKAKLNRSLWNKNPYWMCYIVQYLQAMPQLGKNLNIAKVWSRLHLISCKASEKYRIVANAKLILLTQGRTIKAVFSQNRKENKYETF